MDDFEAFKATREKMDPTSRKMSDHQWKQAYEAHQRAKGRVSSGGHSESSSKRRRRRSSGQSSTARGQHQPSSVSKGGVLRSVVRQQSAYKDLRLIIDLLAWLAIAVVVLGAIVSLFYYTSVAAALVAILGGLLEVVIIVIARLLIQVVIDIPDIALYNATRGPEPEESSVDHEST